MIHSDPGGVIRLNNGTEIRNTDITDFYYTYENINYNAFYQRYRFYTENGKYMFFHETREVKNNYGPATEKDTTLTGTQELTEKEWEEFCGFLQDGSAREREISTDSGDSGPWMYIYLKDGDPEGLEFRFSSLNMRDGFEKYCSRLADK